MSVILAVETSSEGCSVALLKGNDVYDVSEHAPREHTQKLLPMIDRVLSQNKLSLSDLDAIAYGRGPGSFTGLRICLGVVQGLAYGQDIPVIPVSSLETIAEMVDSAQALPVGEHILVANDARMSEVYWCLYKKTPKGLVAVIPESVDAPEIVVSYPEVVALTESPFLAIGSGWHYPALTEFLRGAASRDVQADAPGMLPIALKSLERGDVVTAENAQPVYLRDSVAWKKRQRIRS